MKVQGNARKPSDGLPLMYGFQGHLKLNYVPPIAV